VISTNLVMFMHCMFVYLFVCLLVCSFIHSNLLFIHIRTYIKTMLADAEFYESGNFALELLSCALSV